MAAILFRPNVLITIKRDILVHHTNVNILRFGKFGVPSEIRFTRYFHLIFT